MPSYPLNQLDQAVRRAPKSYAPWLALFLGGAVVYTGLNLKVELDSLDRARDRLYAKRNQREQELKQMGELQ